MATTIERAVGTKETAAGKVYRPVDYTINTMDEFFALARTHVGVYVVDILHTVAGELVAQAETLLNQYELSSKMSGRPYEKVLLTRIESDKWNAGYGILQFAENGAPINGLTRLKTFADSSRSYLSFTVMFGANPKDYYQFDESQSVRTNEDHWRTLGYEADPAKFLSGTRLAAKFHRYKISSRDTEVAFYEEHKKEVDTALVVMNGVLAEGRLPYKEAYYALILAKGVMNKIDGKKYIDLLNRIFVKGVTSNKFEAKFASLVQLLLQNDLKKMSVWTTLRRAAEFTVAAKTPYDVVVIRPKDANTKMSVRLIPGAFKAPDSALLTKKSGNKVKLVAAARTATTYGVEAHA